MPRFQGSLDTHRAAPTSGRATTARRSSAPTSRPSSGPTPTPAARCRPSSCSAPRARATRVPSSHPDPGGRDALRRRHVSDRLRDPSRRARARRRVARLRIAVGARAHAHPGQPQEPVAGRRPTCPRSTGTRYDPFVALAMAAAVTTKLRLGTGICLVIERDPITLAKEVASLDHLSGGRVLFGIGGGWNAEEMENHGTDFKTRCAPAARADPGDEGDLDPGRGRVPRRVRATSTRCWSHPEAGAEAASADPHGRRRADARSTACWSTATAGCRSAGRMGPASPRRSPRCSAGPRTPGAKPLPVTAFMVKPDRAVLAPLAAPASSARSSVCPRKDAEGAAPARQVRQAHKVVREVRTVRTVRTQLQVRRGREPCSGSPPIKGERSWPTTS